MDLSLDDIIKKKKFVGPVPSKFALKKAVPLRRTINKPVFKAAPRFTDARNKIIQNNRARIRDARDKLVEITRNNGDARQRLQQRQQHHVKNGKVPYRNGHIDAQVSAHRVHMKPKPLQQHYRGRQPNVIDVPRGYVDYDNMDRMEQEEYAVASRLSRTVKNDIPNDNYDEYPTLGSKPPPAPRRLNSWGSNSEHFDPFDMYEPKSRHERHRTPERPPPPPPPKGILRPSVRQQTPPDFYERRFIPENTSHLSYEMRSRLERAPDPHISMGIFSSPIKGGPLSTSGYRIVVSNLHSSVTQSDIKELFEDIGDLYDARIVRPGTAEVIYTSLSDAEKAVDTYHNRQLDGQPMKCMLVNPRSSNKPTAPAIKTSSSSSRLTTGKTPLEIDIDALHKVLFRRH